MKDIIIASFYKFIPLNDFESLREPILTKMHEIGIKGTIILAHEGVNGGFAGNREQMNVFMITCVLIRALPTCILKKPMTTRTLLIKRK